MIETGCTREPELVEAIQAGRWPEACDPALRAHVDACGSCAGLAAIVVPLTDEHQALLAEATVPSSAIVVVAGAAAGPAGGGRAGRATGHGRAGHRAGVRRRTLGDRARDLRPDVQARSGLGARRRDRLVELRTAPRDRGSVRQPADRRWHRDRRCVPDRAASRALPGTLSGLIRGASPLELPYTHARSPLRRLAPHAWLARSRSLASWVCELRCYRPAAEAVRRIRPGRAPVCSPFFTTTTPLTST